MAPKKKTPKSKSNGTSKSKGEKNPTRSTPAPPSEKSSKGITVGSSTFVSALVALAAFLGGVLTPPTWHAVKEVMEVKIEQKGQSPPPSTSSSSFIQYDNLPQHTPCTQSNLENYLHQSPVSGMHIICIEPVTLDADGKDQPQTQIINADRGRLISQSNALRLTVYKGSHSSRLLRRVNLRLDENATGGAESVSWKSLEIQLYATLGLTPPTPISQPWAIFTPSGERIVGAEDKLSDEKSTMAKLASSEMLIVFNGGNWMWPGVREGFQRTVELPSTKYDNKARNITIETLSLKPLVVSIEGFLSEEECDYIPQKAGPDMKYSGVSLKDADKGKAASNWRTSQSTFLPATNDMTLKGIEERTAKLTRVPLSHQEYVQVLRYEKTEKYDAHHDYFDPAQYKADQHTSTLIQYGKRNRFATVFWYLTDVEKGGETIFPNQGGVPTPPGWKHSDCSFGLKVKPQKGKVIIFYSLDAMGNLDPLSLHGACPVEEGVKWAANKWVWNAPMHFIQE